MKPQARPARAATPEVAALRLLQTRQPELAAAVDMQIELLALQRRVEARLSTPWVEYEPTQVAARLEAGRPVLRFEDIPFEWTELRLFFRQVADLFHRFEMIEAQDHEVMQRLVRSGRPSKDDVAAWYATGPGHATSESAAVGDLGESFQQVLEVAARPFLARVAATTAGRLDLSVWSRGYCPFCGGAPEIGVVQTSGDGLLACGRCAGLWGYDPRACLHCGNADSSTLRSFTSPDGVYRLVACDSCRRYTKTHDVASAGRPLMLAVDTIATLPLDAAAMRQGYQA